MKRIKNFNDSIVHNEISYAGIVIKERFQRMKHDKIPDWIINYLSEIFKN